jgi:hypothetical protein
MPHINIYVLHDILNRHQMRLYDIYVATTNIEIADAILSERNYIIQMMEQLQELL